jgi:hypothetical protein
VITTAARIQIVIALDSTVTVHPDVADVIGRPKMGDDIDDQGTPDVLITGQHMSAAPASQANSSKSSNSKSGSSKGGRPRDPVREHFDETGPVLLSGGYMS